MSATPTHPAQDRILTLCTQLLTRGYKVDLDALRADALRAYVADLIAHGVIASADVDAFLWRFQADRLAAEYQRVCTTPHRPGG